MIDIVVGGDICPIGRIETAFMQGNAVHIFGDLLEEVTASDIAVANLECPLVTRQTPIVKPGGVIGARVECIKGLAAAGFHVVNLANNHSFDHGETGLFETIEAAKRAGLSMVGVGINIEEAAKPFVKELNGQRIVIYAMAEREFSIATESAPGANPLDIINFVKSVEEHKRGGVFIVLIHGGKEFYPYPSPEMIRRCRFMVDMGADAVVCSHTHCPLPWETYKGRPIVYGLGNLVFEPLGEVQSSWYEGYLAKLSLSDTGIGLEAIPYCQSRGMTGARKLNEPERVSFFTAMDAKGNEIKDTALMQDRWLQYCREEKRSYLMNLLGYNRLMRKFGSTLLKVLHSRDEILRSLLLAQCETHQEVLNTIFRDERGNG